jgi:hypothetical protein
MKNLKLFSLFLLLTICGFSAYAQNGNVVVSHVDVEDLGNGTGMIVVKLSGNLADQYTGGTFTITGDAIAGRTAGGSIGEGGRVVIEPPVPGNGNSNGNPQVLLAAVFPIGTPVTNDNDEVTMTFRLRRIGNGLDYTYSRVGRVRRPTGI